ncbi:MAG TPA: glycosyltransferase family 87 protein [Planctomycetaceae bacterium]|nr:glycosyltransferase family 87 protein [Planctomycetaceae bacterium]
MELVERPVLTWRWLSLLAIGFATAATILTLVRQAGELPVYTTAAERYLRGEQFYRPDDPPAFTYPPFSVLPFVPLTALPPLLRKTPWWIANFSLLAGSLWLLTLMVWPVLRAGVHAGRVRPWVPALAVGLLSGRYLITALNYQSTDYIVLFCVVAAGYGLSRSKGPASGVFAGLATAMKATPLLFLPLLVWQRRWLATAAFVVTLIAATLLPDAFVSNPDGKLWSVTWFERFVSKVDVGAAASAEGAWSSWNPLNQSLPGTLYRLATPIETAPERYNVAVAALSPHWIKRLTQLCELAVVIAIAWCTQPGLSKDDSVGDASLRRLGETGAAICGMLLLSPMTSTQHLCGLCVPMTYCVVQWLYVRRTVALSIVLGMLTLMALCGGKDIVGHTIADWTQAAGVDTLATLACLVGCATSLIRRERRGATP